MAAKAAIQAKELSISDLTSAYISQIEYLNPAIGAVRHTIIENAIQQATNLDAKLARGDKVGPLAGMPVIIKENCDTTGVVCSAGLKFREGHIPSSDSLITSRLKGKGAVILGVSVSDPGAFGVRTAEVTHPMDSSLTVGGSSGGSAAALAAKMCLGAIGTDTGGSIRIPSACCGTVGLKPGPNTLPLDGIFPLIKSLDHVGPMGRNVGDVEALWDALSSKSGYETTTITKIGFDPKHIGEADDQFQSEFQSILETCRDLGIDCLEVTLPDPNAIVNTHGLIFIVEAANHHIVHHAKNIKDYPEIAQEWFLAARELSLERIVDAYTTQSKMCHQVVDIFENVDLILTPTTCVRMPRKDALEFSINGENHDFTMSMVRHTCLFSHSHHPALAMPIATQDGSLPSSLQIVGNYGTENKILTFGRQLENVRRS